MSHESTAWAEVAKHEACLVEELRAEVTALRHALRAALEQLEQYKAAAHAAR
jgi:hypothetical protein